ncbi:hypothetical protein VULLAG_LOCUS6267 [Vulpes lagopus]
MAATKTSSSRGADEDLTPIILP